MRNQNNIIWYLCYKINWLSQPVLDFLDNHSPMLADSWFNSWFGSSETTTPGTSSSTSSVTTNSSVSTSTRLTATESPAIPVRKGTQYSVTLETLWGAHGGLAQQCIPVLCIGIILKLVVTVTS